MKFRGESTFRKYPNLLSVKGLTHFLTEVICWLISQDHRLNGDTALSCRFQGWTLISYSHWAFRDKSLLPKMEHWGHERVCGACVMILVLRRTPGVGRKREGRSLLGRYPEALCGWHRSRRSLRNSLENPQLQRRREETNSTWKLKHSLRKRVTC